MNRIIGVPRLLATVAAMATVALTAASPAVAGNSASNGGAASAGYNAIPSKVSGNVPSVSFEGAPASEFGDEVALGGKARMLGSMSVLLSSWGCEDGDWSTGSCRTTPGATFTVPITFTIYADNGGAAGDVLAQKTVTMTVPYRPSASPQCTGADAGKWYNSKDRTCYNGLPYLATVNLSSLAVTLPDRVIWSVQYNTTTSGYSPVGSSACVTESGGCGYDSLNVGANTYPNAPFAGTDLDENAAFYNGSMQSGWTGNRPLGAISTS